MELLSSLLVLAVTTIAGFVGALLGIGGGSLMVPFFTVNLGIPVKTAVSVSLTSLIATSLMGSSVYLRQRLVNLRLAVVLESTTILGSLVGASLTIAAPSHLIELVFGLVLSYSFVTMLYKTFRPGHESTGPSPGLEPNSTGAGLALGRPQSSPYGYHNTHVAAGLSFLAGVVSGMLGVGGGLVKVPILDIVAGIPIKSAIATSNYMIGITASAGASVYILRGLVVPELVLLSVVGITVGSRAGAYVMTRLRSRTLRVLFSVLLAYYSARMIQRGVSAWLA